MKYDDANWHSGGDFPDDLPVEAGGTHTAMFVAWAMLAGLVGDLHVDESRDCLAPLRERRLSPGEFFFEVCDGKLTDEDLSEEGNAFAQAYFDFEVGQYLSDYNVLVHGLPSQYHVPDTWQTFDRISPVLDQRLREWRDAQRN